MQYYIQKLHSQSFSKAFVPIECVPIRYVMLAGIATMKILNNLHSILKTFSSALKTLQASIPRLFGRSLKDCPRPC